MCLAFGGGVWKGPTKSSNLVVLIEFLMLVAN